MVRYSRFPVHPLEITLIEAYCDQLMSLGANLTPFLSHNDTNRTLMAANMQKQALLPN